MRTPPEAPGWPYHVTPGMLSGVPQEAPPEAWEAPGGATPCDNSRPLKPGEALRHAKTPGGCAPSENSRPRTPRCATVILIVNMITRY